MLVTSEMMSKQQVELMQKLGKKPEKDSRLLLTLSPKKKVIICYRYLKWLLLKEIELTNVHAIFEDQQLDFFSEIIEFIANKRKESKTKIQAQAFKSLLCFFYGKALSSTKNYLSSTFCYNKEMLRKQTSKLNFSSYNEIADGIGFVTFSRKSYVAKNLVYIAFFILQNAKLNLLIFFYDYMRISMSKLSISTKLAYQDTDCYISYHKHLSSNKIRLNEQMMILPSFSQNSERSVLDDGNFFNGPRVTENPTLPGVPGTKEQSIYVALRFMKDQIDSSGINLDHEYFTHCISNEEREELVELRKTNKKRLHTIGFEAKKKILRYCGVLPKVYSIQVENEKDICKMKGMSLKNIDMDISQYLEFELGNKLSLFFPQTIFRAKKLKMYHETFIKKIGKLERKRWWHGVGSRTFSLSYGNVLIPFANVAIEVMSDLLDIVCASETAVAL